MQGGDTKSAAYIAMASEVLKELDLTQGALGQDLLAKDIGDLFDGDTLIALVVDGGAVRRQGVISRRFVDTHVTNNMGH